jgi:hypothetical protein
MLTKGFYYFLMIGELAILGLIMAGIVLKIKRIIQLHAVRIDDQNSEHGVSGSDHFVVPGDAAVSTHPNNSLQELTKGSLPSALPH